MTTPEQPSDHGYFQGMTAAQIETLFKKIDGLKEDMDKRFDSLQKNTLTPLKEKVDRLDNWHWMVMGIATTVATLISWMIVTVKEYFK